MVVAAEGILSTPLDQLRKSVAGSARFRTWTGTASEALALARVGLVKLASTVADPCAWVELGDLVLERKGTGFQPFIDYADGAALALWFRGPVTIGAGETDQDAQTRFANEVGVVLAEMFALVGTSGYLDFTRARVVEVLRTEEDEEASPGAFFTARCEVNVPPKGAP